MTYRLTPVINSRVNNDVAYKNIMEKFAYGKRSTRKTVYYDEENRRRMNYIRLAHAQVAMSLAEAGRKEEARKILEHFDQQVSEKDFPYGMTSNRETSIMLLLLSSYRPAIWRMIYHLQRKWRHL